MTIFPGCFSQIFKREHTAVDEKHNDHIADQRHKFAEDRAEPVQKVQKSNKIGTFVLYSHFHTFLYACKRSDQLKKCNQIGTFVLKSHIHTFLYACRRSDQLKKCNQIDTFVLKSRPILSFQADFSALVHYKLLHFREILVIDCFGDHCTLYIILGADNNISLK